MSAHDSGGSGAALGVLWNGVVEGQYIRGIMLDTGCSRTMVRRNLVSKAKWLKEEVVTGFVQIL